MGTSVPLPGRRGGGFACRGSGPPPVVLADLALSGAIALEGKKVAATGSGLDELAAFARQVLTAIADHQPRRSQFWVNKFRKRASWSRRSCSRSSFLAPVRDARLASTNSAVTRGAQGVRRAIAGYNAAAS